LIHRLLDYKKFKQKTLNTKETPLFSPQWARDTVFDSGYDDS